MFGLKGWLASMGMSAEAAASTAALATGVATAATGSAVARAMMPEIDSGGGYSSETATQYEDADPATTEVAIGQETSTTSRKKKSKRGRTTPSIDAPAESAAPVTATSTGLQI